MYRLLRWFSGKESGDKVWSLGWEDPLEKEMATLSSTLAWEIPWMEESGGLQSKGSQRVGHTIVTEQQQQTTMCVAGYWGHIHSSVMMQFSVQFSRSVVSDSLRPHESQHTRPPCPSPTPGVYSSPCPSSRWCHPTISSSVVPSSSCPQSLPASGFFQMSQLFASGGQSTGLSALASVFPMNTQDWSPLGWTGWISLLVQGTHKSLLQHHSSKASILWCSAFFIVQLSHDH